ncbi:hypothetical protein ACFW3D_30250 [Streptomyces sp. NPDC058864]
MPDQRKRSNHLRKDNSFSPNDFTDLAQVRDRVRAFEDRYNTAAQPFQWRFTTSDLDDLLARPDRHQESSIALAA